MVRWKIGLIGWFWFLGAFRPGAMAQEPGERPLGPGEVDRAPETTGVEGAADGRIAVNRAGLEELMRLPGVGPKKAQALLEARARRPFRRPSDLRRVKGFGPRTIQRLVPRLSFE